MGLETALIVGGAGLLGGAMGALPGLIGGKPKIPEPSDAAATAAEKARAEQLAAAARQKNSRRSTLLTGRTPLEPMGQSAGKSLMGE